MSRPRIELGSQELASCAITARPPQHDTTGARHRAFDVFQGSCYSCAAEIFQHDMWKEMKATAEKRRLVHLGHKVSILAMVTCTDSTVKGHTTAIAQWPLKKWLGENGSTILPTKCSCHTAPCPTVEKTATASPAVNAIVSEKWQTF